MCSRVVVNEGPTNRSCGSRGDKIERGEENKKNMYEVYVTISLARVKGEAEATSEWWSVLVPKTLRRNADFTKRAARFTLASRELSRRNYMADRRDINC